MHVLTVSLRLAAGPRPQLGFLHQS